MQEKAKSYAIFCQNSAKICETVQKQSLFSPIKHLFCLRKRSKSTFQHMKVCSKWVCLEVSWVDFECFQAIWWRSRWLLNRFWRLLTPFEPFFDPIWGYTGSFWADFVPSLGRSGVILGSLYERFGIVLASFWGAFLCRFDPHFEPFWCVFDPFGRFWGVLGQNHVIFGGCLV